MSDHSPSLLLEDHVPEPRLKLALAERGCRYTHCVLSTTKQDLYYGQISGSDTEVVMLHVRMVFLVR